MILLIGDATDPHLLAIQREISLIKNNAIILDTSKEGLLNTEFSYLSEQNDFCIRQNDRLINLQEIKAVFCSSPFHTKKGFISSQEKEFWYFTWRESLYGYFSKLVEQVYFLNKSVAHSINAQNKITFFSFAERSEIKTPSSLITNNKHAIDDFFSKHQKVLLKTMHQIYLEYNGEQTMMLVKEIEHPQLSSFSSNGECPLFLQQKIDKKFDIRVTVIGNKILSCKIDASRSQYGNLDWRAYDLPNTVHSVYELPLNLQNNILKMMKLIELDYACLDFCVDTNDEYWLLDINPFGKYMWIELALNLPISKEIAYYLCNSSYFNNKTL